ncbi:hypothetical protein [Crocosphaera chwakensis]|uniref:Uncharacterized protein n=1 Tax=Crocosphaera chwakensis CCY0110 TaxID=391612 RepID=A3IMF1_9CHRO|nr:hypothetical protein [Crocosphaera chwakensis]EAZ92320.1 hypothetical protein CY0110_28214 [Crocosphaera chwakensis CCY0110]
MMTMFGFLGGTIMAVESGYKVWPHPNSEKIYNRLSDAKWFLAVRWCDNLLTPAAIINNMGELTFINQFVLKMGEEKFIPQQYRLDIFAKCLPLLPNEIVTYELNNSEKILEIRGLEIDSRYGKVALVTTISVDH